MRIKHYTVNIPIIETPNKEWKQCWYGLSRLKECYSDKAWQQFKDAEGEAHRLGYLGEKELEVDLFLSILNEIKSGSITFLELGAGYADWCMALNGVIRNKIIDTPIKEVKCYAVEAEPSHVLWATKHFHKWDINGNVIPAVVSDRNGYCSFAVDKDPSSNYGQSATFTDSILRTAGNILRRKSVSSPCHTLDWMVDKHGIRHIDFIDMDVQGNEVRVTRGAMESIKAGLIDYWKIGTHGRKYNNQLREMLSPYYNLVADIYPYSIGGVDGLVAKVEDGIQVYQRKGL